MDLATAHGDVSLLIQARRFLSMGYTHMGDYDQAIALLRQNVAALEGKHRYERPAFANFMPFVFSASGLACCLAEVGEFDQGNRLSIESLQVAEQACHIPSQIWALFQMTLVCLLQGDLPTVISLGGTNSGYVVKTGITLPSVSVVRFREAETERVHHATRLHAPPSGKPGRCVSVASMS